MRLNSEKYASLVEQLKKGKKKETIMLVLDMDDESTFNAYLKKAEKEEPAVVKAWRGGGVKKSVLDELDEDDEGSKPEPKVKRAGLGMDGSVILERREQPGDDKLIRTFLEGARFRYNNPDNQVVELEFMSLGNFGVMLRDKRPEKDTTVTVKGKEISFNLAFVQANPDLATEGVLNSKLAVLAELL